MQVQKIQTMQQTDTQATNFNGAGDLLLRYLATNQALGANAVDLTAMVIPRTASDTIRRGPNAGLETGRRESMGTINDTFIGVYGATAGAIVAGCMGLNNKYGEKIRKVIKGKTKEVNSININKILTAPETLDILAENKARQFKNNTTQLDYLKETLKNVKAFNPSHQRADAEGFVSLSDETVEKVSKWLNTAIDDKQIKYEIWGDKHSVAEGRQAIMNLITEDTGAQAKYVLNSLERNGLKSETDLERLVGDIFITSKSFNSKPVQDAFKEQIKTGKGIKDNTFIKSMTKFMKLKSGFGFAIAAAIGMSVQPINMYLTKKKTGSDGFVGVEGRTKDNSLGFKVLKVGTAVAGMTGILASMGCNLKKPLQLPKEFLGKMAFKGFWPTIYQLKGIYGVTILSRFLSTRDKDELRESVTKDTLGYVSWLILGDIVNRLVAEKSNPTVMNRTKAVADNQSIWKRAFNSKLKTRDEVLIEELKKNGIKSTKEVDGKVYAKTFKEMLSDLEKLTDTKAKEIAKKRLKTLNKAQLAGYLFSGVVLGLGIPNLNIAITNSLEKKRKEKAATQNTKPLIA